MGADLLNPSPIHEHARRQATARNQRKTRGPSSMGFRLPRKNRHRPRNRARCLALAKKIKPDKAYAKIKNVLGYEGADEGAEIRAQIDKLLELLGSNGGNKLKDAWRLFRRPFYVQCAVACALFGWLGYAIETATPARRRRTETLYHGTAAAIRAGTAHLRSACAGSERQNHGQRTQAMSMASRVFTRMAYQRLRSIIAKTTPMYS